MLDTILCIDDDPIALMLCRKVIAKSNFSEIINSASNGEQALEYFNLLKEANKDNITKKQPQLIFLDLNMPVMGGWEFLDHFSSSEYSEFNNIQIIVLSSTIDPEDLEKSKTYSMVIDFLPKPITLSMLEYVKTKMR